MAILYFNVFMFLSFSPRDMFLLLQPYHLSFYSKSLTLSFLVPVIAVIAATLFPLWPAEMRVGVYYLSVGAGCFVASILLLAVGKYCYHKIDLKKVAIEQLDYNLELR